MDGDLPPEHRRGIARAPTNFVVAGWGALRLVAVEYRGSIWLGVIVATWARALRQMPVGGRYPGPHVIVGGVAAIFLRFEVCVAVQFVEPINRLLYESSPVVKGEDDWYKSSPEVDDTGKPIGEAHDGDTFRLSDGRNARLYGYDAFELDQQGRRPDGTLAPLGQQSRSALLPYLSGSTATTAGKPSYGRPVMSLDQSGTDPVVPLLQGGNGLAAPEYLGPNSPLLPAYMEAERFARQNRRGAFGTTFATPKAARRGNGEPWTGPKDGAKEAVFFDDPTPMQGMRPEDARELERLWVDRSVTADQLNAFVASKGYKLDPKALENRANPNVRLGGKTEYSAAPRLLTDVGDGRLGATVRGFADPVNMLDEMGAVADTLTGVGGRESIWNSDRRFGDILANNLDQNRSILANDDANYPWWRFGGQMASGLIAPGGSVEGVGLNAARAVLRSGGTRFAAQKAAEAALRGRLATVGAIEGGLAGFGQGEALGERLGGAAIGAPAGGVLGVATGYGLPAAGRLLTSRTRRRLADAEADPAAHQFVNGAGDAAQADAEDYAIGAAPAFDGSEIPAPARQDMASELDQPTIYGLDMGGTDVAPRSVDRIDVEQQPRPFADGPTGEQRRQAAGAINPRDMLPLPANTVDGIDEAMRIDAGRVAPVRAPDEMQALESRTIPSPVDGSKTMQKRGPLDLVTWLRTQGGIKAQGGELEHAGIDNAPRQGLDFAGGEGRFGKLVSNDGMTYDEAALRAWEAGYFPDMPDRPTPAEFLDALTQTHNGNARRFRLDDQGEIDDFLIQREARWAVEAAQAEGAPLSVDRGQPVDMADLDANSAPVTAYEEWGENAPNFAGNINLANLDSPQAIKRALTQTDRVAGDLGRDHEQSRVEDVAYWRERAGRGPI